MPKSNDDLFLPELISPLPGSWEKFEVELQDAAVNMETKQAFVPRAYTEAQELARLHEATHLKHSPHPKAWVKYIQWVIQSAESRMSGKKADPRAADKISKMLEENRIDWIAWDRKGIDIRPCRETLDWAKMPEPPTVLYSLGMCLQLAWTVWASRGLGGKSGLSNPPPPRTVDVDTAEYFDRCWAVLVEENEPLARTMIRACMKMYASPTNKARNMAAAELLMFFPLEEEPEDKPPPPKKEEKEKQRQAEQQEQEREQFLDEMETGVGGEVVTSGGIQYHDHTANILRPTMRITRRVRPVSQGPGLRFPHRYFLDKSIFGQRTLTEGGLMIDGSGSMAWTNDDMKILMEKLPAITIGVYSGVDGVFLNGEKVYGRICIIAKNGKFSRYEGLDLACNGSNDVDYEALQLLATWPRPRLWLSDGQICGGRYSGQGSLYAPQTGAYKYYGRLYELCNSLMKSHEIYRVPDRATMHQLLKRDRVTLARTAIQGPGENYYKPKEYPDPYEPISFQL